MRGSRRRASSAPGLARLRGSRAWRLEDAWPDEGVTYDFKEEVESSPDYLHLPPSAPPYCSVKPNMEEGVIR